MNVSSSVSVVILPHFLVLQVFVPCSLQRMSVSVAPNTASDGRAKDTDNFPTRGTAVRLVTPFGVCACAGAAANSESAPSKQGK